MEYWETYEWNPNTKVIADVVARLKDGQVGIVPTDTIYALVCALDNKKGLERICRILNKKPEKANLSIIVPNLKNISDYTLPFSTPVYKVLKRFLPGPYTFILKANSKIPKFFLNNRKTLGIRMPNNAITLQICDLLAMPLIAGSIHSEDEILDYITDPDEISFTYENLVDFMLSGGAGGNNPSTVVDLCDDTPALIRLGKGAWE
jgi:tRNA threonylcarbamoyl adenosine modification protein (Sua5/YciO/YrdC/YwlC family)